MSLCIPTKESTIMRRSYWLGALCALVLLAACSDMKESATQAVSSAETALADIKEAAAEYAPDDFHAVESQIASLKDSLAKSDYKAVIAATPNVTSAINGLASTVKVRQSQIAAAAAQAAEKWKSLGEDVPKMLEAISSRIAILSKSKRLPQNVDKAALESARSGLDSMQADWAEADSWFSIGKVSDAVAKAQAVKEKGMEVLRKLGMTSV
jgi:hypothetical protein